MKKYTIGQLQDFHDYLSLSVKEGYITQELMDEIERTQNWEIVEKMGDRGDDYANRNEV